MLKFIDRLERKVNLVRIGSRADLPVFDYEVVNADGEVVEHGEIVGNTALTMTAIQKGWAECA